MVYLTLSISFVITTVLQQISYMFPVVHVCVRINWSRTHIAAYGVSALKIPTKDF